MLIRFNQSQVNRYLLHKQHLLRDSQGTDVLSVVCDVGPIRAAPPIVPYLCLWARMRGFARERLDTALYEERSLLRVPAMGARLYLVPSSQFSAYHRATSPWTAHSLEQLDMLMKEAQRGRDDGPKLPRSETLAQRVLEVLSTRDACTIDELTAILPELETHISHDPEVPELGYSRLGSRLIPAMCAQGLLVRARPRGGWRSEMYAYASLSSWAPTTPVTEAGHGEALRRVVRWYLSAYGPATIGDICHWLGGLTRRRVASVLMDLSTAVVHVQVDGSPGDYVMLAGQVDALDAFSAPDGEVCLLSPGDSYVAAYADPERLMAGPYRDGVLDRGGEASGTVWLDGLIVGVWGLRARPERVWVRFYEAVDPEVLASVGERIYTLADAMVLPSLDIDMRTAVEGARQDRIAEGALASPE